MVSTPLVAVLALGFAVALWFLVLAGHTYRAYDSVGVGLFSALLALVGVRLLVGLVTVVPLLVARGGDVALGAAQSLDVATTGELVVVGVLTAVNASVVSLIVATWVAFAAVYTIQLDASRGRLLAYVAVPILAVFLPASLLDIGIRTGLVGGEAALLARDLGRLLARGIVLGGTVLGVGLLGRVAVQYEYFPDRLAATVSGAMVIHVVLRAVLQEVSGALPLRLVVLVGTGLSVLTLGLFAAALRQGLFDALPAAGTVGPQVLFEEFDAPIVVLDFTGRVTDMNAAAGTVFDVDPGAAVGGPLAAVLPADVDADHPDALPAELSVPGKDVLLAPQSSTVTDRLDREIGHGVLFRDVTDARRREQQVGVLNRVLRHNLRNDGGVVINYASLLAEGEGDPEAHGATVEEVMTDLVETGDLAREAERVVAADPTTPGERPLAELVASAVEDAGAGEVATDVAGGIAVRSNPSVLVPTVRELVDNAVEHGVPNPDGGGEVAAGEASGAPVRVTATPEAGGGVTLTVADDGPGISEYEVEALHRDAETSLSHGSGLGLSLVRWGVERLGGRVDFEATAADGTGTTVSVTLPPSHVGRE
jgi:signal transduction histidine kinase